MTEQSCILNNFYPNGWAKEVQNQYWPINLPITERLKENSPTPSSPIFSPVAGSSPAQCPSKRQQALDHFSARIIDSGLIGTDVAVDYLRDKYRNNLTISTIRQAGYTTLLFLNFLKNTGTNIFVITRPNSLEAVKTAGF